MGKKLSMISVGLVVFVVVLVAFASTALASYDYTNHAADKSMVVNSPHDVNADNPCTSCHIPHDADGEFLWARPYSTLTTGADDVTTNDDAGISTDIKPMCYSCHDGTIASAGLNTAFSANHTNHRTRAATAIRSSTGQPYGPDRDCDLCHDPHDDGNTDFLKYERYSSRDGGHWYTITAGGNVCSSCHTGNVDGAIDGTTGEAMINHPTNVVPSASSVPADALWIPAAGDYSGTRLFDPVSGLVSSAATAQAMCGSCHTAHGADPAATYMAGTSVVHSLNTMATGAGELCLNCHAN